MKKNNNTNNKSDDNLALPQFGCKCGLEYSSLSSLSNHIKMTHNNNTEEYKLKRGVPEGRRQRLNPILKESIQKMIKQNEKIRKDELSENLTINESRGIFMQNIKYIDELVEKNNLTKQQEIILQKEHIKFQELWNDLDISQIAHQTQIYLHAYCCVSFQIPHILLKKEEEQEESQKQNQQEQNSDHIFFYFYKNLLSNHKPSENNEFKQSSSSSSPITQQSKDKPILQNNNNQLSRNIPTNYKNSSNNTQFNNSNNKINDNNNNNINDNDMNNDNNNNSNNQQENQYSKNSTSTNSPKEEKYFVNVHPSLNLNEDQYMQNFFKNYLIDNKKKKLQSQLSSSSSSSSA